MNTLKGFEDCFVRIDTKIIPKVVGIERTRFSFDIYIENAFMATNSIKLLQEFFGGVNCKCEPVPGTQNLIVRISRVEIPKEGYDLFKIIKFLEENKDNGFFLGITEFGPKYLSLKRFTHLAIFGTSGFGKSVFFKNLISQSLSFFEDTVNYIIDAKKIDYLPFERHSRIGGIYSNVEEISTFIGALHIECAFRAEVFSTAFSNPPSNFDEYVAFRRTFSREDLPEFKRIFVWVDEAKLALDNDIQSEFVNLLIRKSRAFGIHFIFASQRAADIGSLLTQIPTIISFYTNDTYRSFDNMPTPPQLKAIVGRLILGDSENLTYHEIQSPFLNAEDAIGLSLVLGDNHKSIEKKSGITRLKIPFYHVNDFNIIHRLLAGQSLKGILEITEKENSTFRVLRVYKPKYVEKYWSKFYEVTNTLERELDDKNNAKIDLKKETKSELNIPSSRDKALDNILDDFLEILNNQEIEIEKKEKNLSSIVDSLPIFKKTENSLNFEDLIKKIQLKYDNSSNDFSWCRRDLSGNVGLQKIHDELKGFSDSNNLALTLNDLAIDSNALTSIKNWENLVNNSLRIDRPSPLLIISSTKGMGKKTILESIANSLNLKYRKANHLDLRIGKNENSFAIEEEIEKGKENKKNRPNEMDFNVKKSIEDKFLIVFSELEVALQYSRNNINNNPIVVIIEQTPHPFYGIENVERNTFDEVKHCPEANMHIHISQNYYSKAVIGNKLIKNLLISRKFLGNLDSIKISNFAKAQIELIPCSIANIIDHAKRIAFMQHVDFKEEVLLNVLAQITASKWSEKSEAVTVVQPQLSWKDFIIDKDIEEQLSIIRFRANNFEKTDFEFASKLRKCPRLVTLFWGDPGTGKSMAGEVLAKETKRELWLCDLGKMQSAFVGGTEKILSDMFDQSSAADAILQLDEADAFILNRANTTTEYTKKIVNHLLNLIENYKGILILTTNLADQIDPAFSRRIDFKINFKRPSSETQIKLLESMLLPDAPLEKDVNIKLALDGLNLTGGLIRNSIERVIAKMGNRGLKTISHELLRECLREIAMEDRFIADKTKKAIGLTE